MAVTPAGDSEAELLRALVAEQMAQITDLTRRLAAAEAARDASAEPHLLRAGMEALERRLVEAGHAAEAREATLAAQILVDGAALQEVAAETAALRWQIAELQRQLQPGLATEADDGRIAGAGMMADDKPSWVVEG